MPVAVVLVSHSAEVARGTADVARQMAPDVAVVPVGGAPGGGLGTDLDRVVAALAEHARAAGHPEAGRAGGVSPGGRPGEGAHGVVVLGDLGSAVLTAETALELVAPREAAVVRVVDGPFVEGAVAAAVAAQQGGDLDAVVAAVVAVGRSFADAVATGPADAGAGRAAGPDGRADGAGAGAGAGPADVVRRVVVLTDPLGLHARPAAVVARLAATLPAPVRVAGADARSMLELMRLATRQGDEVVVEAAGEGAAESVDAVADAIVAAAG